jgi:hypothetical protein
VINKLTGVAINFYLNHTEHVEKLMKEAKVGIQPTGQDAFHPELWKGIHWKYYFDKQVEGE